MKDIRVIVVETADDAERKRVEYVLEKWRRNASRLKGIVIRFEGSPEAFLKELSQKLTTGSVRVFKAFEEEVEVEREKRTAHFVIERGREEAEKLLSFLLAKMGASLREMRRFDDFSELEYGLYTRKGGVVIRITLRSGEKEGKERTDVHVHVEGASEAPADVLKSLEKDLSFFGAQCKE